VAFASSIGVDPADNRILTISEKSGEDLWSALEQVRLLKDRGSRED